MLDENFISDIKNPPKYDWFTKIPKRNEDQSFLDTFKEECYCTIAQLKNDEFTFVNNCYILKVKSKKIGIFEDTFKFYKHVKKERLKIYWHGKIEKSFFGRKYLIYELGLENLPELFNYKSVILKITDF
ncbi:hypothetical protein TUBRATIS_008230 [Tubulinosema ratisbonensis]|uniref:Uncharacterized protein n=1 Tax=Tubulinosema ratisbonensis TaxID=291195 RepID=A0A437ANM1_9MICR|nr:hypothetical protein TUBRATIS_008230 [Tubulinosema ratisbonensis]